MNLKCRQNVVGQVVVGLSRSRQVCVLTVTVRNKP